MNTATRPGKSRKGKGGGRSARPAGDGATGDPAAGNGVAGAAAGKAPVSDADRFSDPMQSIGYLCRINFRGFARELEHRIARYGVSSGQWRSLRVLWEEDNITQRELSDRVGATEATTVPMIRTLVRDGFVVRREDADDRRKVRIVLTPKARRLKRKLMPFVGEVNDLAVRGVSAADQAVVRRVLAQIHRNLSALP